jgi:hypothetical protein
MLFFYPEAAFGMSLANTLGVLGLQFPELIRAISRQVT